MLKLRFMAKLYSKQTQVNLKSQQQPQKTQQRSLPVKVILHTENLFLKN